MAGMSGFGEPAIQLPPGFDEEAFVAQAKDHYVKLQKAWDDNDLARVQDYFSADLFEMLQAERSKLATDLPATSVVSLMVELVRGEFIGSTASISLRFTGWIKEGDQTDETNEVWHLEKDMTSQTAAWIIVGIQQDN
jgi:predicted lipid-binding transport protein (Tim44 family)